MLEVQCGQCGTRLRLEDHWAGKKGKCPRCECVLDLPGRPAPEAPATEPSRPPPLPGSPPETEPATPTVPWLHRVGALPRKWRIAAGTAGVLLLGTLGILLWAVAAGRPDSPVVSGRDRRSTAGSEGEVDSPRTPNGPATMATGERPPAPEIEQAVRQSLSPSSMDLPREAASGRVGRSPDGSSGEGLVGMTREYDDLACQQIQFRHGVRIPSAAAVLEVDGVRLPIRSVSSLAESPAPFLFLPRGVHAVRFRTTERPVEVTIRSDLSRDYQSMRGFFGLDGTVRADELMRRGAWAMDVHGAPFLLNFMGARHVKEESWDVAERMFRRSLSVNPTFSPAHLNLAECLLRRGAREEAIREINAADVFNVGNVHGLADAVSRLRRRLEIPVDCCDPVEADALSYVTTEPLSEEDVRLVALLEGISRYVVKAEERGKTLNNLAVHFADKGRFELALHHFRNALDAVKHAGPERYAVAQKVFSNMSAACRKGGLAEAEEYEQMQHLVTP